jgi:hypothetical protein
MVKQYVDATYVDVSKRELLGELGLRVIEVKCTAPVMWITPSHRICKGFPMVINHDTRSTKSSPVISDNKDTPVNSQNLHLSLYVS